MKILTINKYYWKKGGSETVFFNEKELLESNNHQVVPFSMSSQKNLGTPYSHFFIDEIDYDTPGITTKIKAATSVLYSFDARKKMTALLREFVPDIAHFHIFQHQISPSVFGPLKQLGIPLVLTLHDLKPICPTYKMYTDNNICEACKGHKFYHCFSKRCNKGSAVKSLISAVEMYLHFAMRYYQQVDQYIAVSKFYQQKMIEHGFPESQITYIPNYIDTKDFPLSENDGKYVLSFGRLSEEKGIETLVLAAELCPHISFIIAGAGPSENELKQLTVDKGLTNIKFTGFITGIALRELISGASFTVITSKWYENCPMSVLESMAYGKPVVGANIGGIPELINDQSDGLIFNPGDHEDLATKIQTLWNMGSKRVVMGKAGRDKIKTEFTAENHYEQLLSLYKQLAH